MVPGRARSPSVVPPGPLTRKRRQSPSPTGKVDTFFLAYFVKLNWMAWECHFVSSSSYFWDIYLPLKPAWLSSIFFNFFTSVDFFLAYKVHIHRNTTAYLNWILMLCRTRTKSPPSSTAQSAKPVTNLSGDLGLIPRPRGSRGQPEPAGHLSHRRSPGLVTISSPFLKKNLNMEFEVRSDGHDSRLVYLVK